jgi:hypothetical protein
MEPRLAGLEVDGLHDYLPPKAVENRKKPNKQEKLVF